MIFDVIAYACALVAAVTITLLLMGWSNCYIYAIRRWMTHGGSIVMKQSDYGWWPHMAWSGDLRTVEHFVPIAPVAKDRQRIIPRVLFLGVAKSVPSDVFMRKTQRSAMRAHVSSQATESR
jgi:hypothetical protein